MDNTRKLTTSALMVAISAVLALTLYLLPAIQGAVFVIALPIIIIGVKYDYKFQLISLLALGLLLMTLDPFYSCITLMLVGPLSLTQGYCIRKQKKSSEIIFYGTIAFAFGMLALLYLTNLILGISVIEELSNLTTTMVDEMKVFYSTTSSMATEELNSFLAGLEQLKEFVVLLMPSFIVFFSFMSSILSFVMTRTLLKRTDHQITKSYFKDFRMDKNRRMTLIIVMLVVTAMTMMDKSNMDYYIINFMSMVILLFQINGLALIWYVTDKHPNQKALRIITVIAFLVSPFVGVLELIVRYGFALIGLLDMYLDFRMKIQSNKK